MPQRVAPPSGDRSSRYRLSTAQTLSLVTVGVVVVVLATAMAAVRVALTRSAIEVAQNRLDRSVKQLASVSAASLHQRQSRYESVAHRPAVLGALREPAPPRDDRIEAVRASLASLRTPSDSGLPTELWNSKGERVAFVGDDVGEPIALQIRSESSSHASEQRPGLDLLNPSDSLQLGSLYRVGSRTLYWLALPVRSGGRPVGFIVQQRRIATNPEAERTIRELSGNSAAGYYHNVDGTSWTTFGGMPALPPDTAVSERSGHLRPGIGPVIYAEERVPGTPVALAMEVPRAVVVARAAATMRRLTLLAGALTVFGALVAWLVGQRVARPLMDVATAAEAIARGDYSARVPTTGNVEVSRLASSFNRMASQVGESRSMLEAREAELRTLANAIPQLAWMADAEGNAFWFNDRWYDFTGFARDQAPASLWAEALHPGGLTEVLSGWQSSVRSGNPFEMEVRLRAQDGSYRWFLTRVAPVRHLDGHVLRWFGTSTDIQTLREAREAAEAGNRAKSDFLAAMSHELRTPLNAIGGYAELIDMGLRGPVSEEQHRDLARIRTSQAHLLGLIGSLLDLNRVENGLVTYDIESIGVDPVLADLEALVLPQATAKEQALVYEAPQPGLSVLADREKLRQVLLNLLSNAVRHSPVGAAITITAERREPGMVAIMVRDTGPGIPHDRQASIFEPFVQLDRSLTSKTHGVGLGLAISRDLARGMGGELTVVSVLHEGACFALTLPAGDVADGVQMARSSEMPAVRFGKRV